MKNKKLESRLSGEIEAFIASRKSLNLATTKEDGSAYASYAPFAIGDECLYVLLSEIAVHAVNLQHNPQASVLIIEDEDDCGELFARIRVNYTVNATLLDWDTPSWKQGIEILAARHGERIHNLSQHEDFKLFRLTPARGRYVKGFGRAYELAGETLTGEAIDQLRDGHKPRSVA
ncbi:HugZ family protein [Microbulbifer sp. TYP-18]|uniref:HugZ family protein n=1 Tax=Microbulbifer sp. TYP-18 TaxID=3230024 RepID=UPI0034C61C64